MLSHSFLLSTSVVDWLWFSSLFRFFRCGHCLSVRMYDEFYYWWIIQHHSYSCHIWQYFDYEWLDGTSCQFKFLL